MGIYFHKLGFGLPKSLQSDKTTVPQVVTEALGIVYHLHCAWKPWSFGKVKNE